MVFFQDLKSARNCNCITFIINQCVPETYKEPKCLYEKKILFSNYIGIIKIKVMAEQLCWINCTSVPNKVYNSSVYKYVIYHSCGAEKPTNA